MLNHCFDPENQMNLWLWSPLIVQLCAATRCGLNVNQILCSLLIQIQIQWLSFFLFCYSDVTHESTNGLGVCLALWSGVYSKVSGQILWDLVALWFRSICFVKVFEPIQWAIKYCRQIVVINNNFTNVHSKWDGRQPTWHAAPS